MKINLVGDDGETVTVHQAIPRANELAAPSIFDSGVAK